MTLFGSVLDIAADRTYELVLWAVFADAGSVWFASNPVNGFDLRETAGLGLRYLTPVGPIGIDYAWKLDRRDGESAAEWHFTIGAVF